ncbi:MAG: hypothetical protein ABIP48_17310 [Planctomycetota bacterium]
MTNENNSKADIPAEHVPPVPPGPDWFARELQRLRTETPATAADVPEPPPPVAPGNEGTDRLLDSFPGPDPLARRAPRVFHKPGEGPCNWCHHFAWWRSVHGVVVCGRCHPPAMPSLAVEWLKPSEN